MSASSQIVCGGGWKGTRSAKVKVKAWFALFIAIGFGSVAVVANEPVWMVVSGIPATVTWFVSIALFIRERPREFQVPGERAGQDPRKL